MNLVPDNSLWFAPAVPFLFLYAETHFRFFRFSPNFLYRNSPEILFDMPARLAPDRDLPVLLLLNDTDRFPVEILHVSLSISSSSSKPRAIEFSSPEKHLLAHPLDFQSRAYLFVISRDMLNGSPVYVNGKALVRRKKKEFVVINDNFITSSKAPLVCTIADESL
ncbi:MAG: hypothetical protein GF350_06105, partial [Chitinivibrionales bacterium]|nr:hypothetical protein [Chitinivibrionales bacterium]